jgi:glycosyltransferase involved in cell wall biosynthesis
MRLRQAPWLLYGLISIGAGLVTYFFGFLAFHRGLLWYSGVPILLGALLIAVDLGFLMPLKRRQHDVRFDMPASLEVTAVLTAYNDEASIGEAVDDFRSHPRVKRVLVVDNNSSDGTAEAARRHGAIVVTESKPGYGHCVHRALREGMAYEDTELTLLCEGDCTFRAFDVDKFLAYIPHADVVNGTRIVEQLRSPKTQLTTFMYYGNFFVGKLLEAKHLGTGTFTDVGTTYKLCRNRVLQDLLPRLNPAVNLEFNAHFLDTALHHGVEIVECPVTFFARIGESKGGNVSNRRALKVGLRMIKGLIFGWPAAHEETPE